MVARSRFQSHILMAAGCSTTIRLLVTAIWITPFLVSTTTKAEEPYNIACSVQDGNYTANSAYRANLNVLLGSLASITNTTAAAGFSTNITGEAPDRVFGLALCRGDATPAECGTCVQIAASDIRQICPFRNSAMLWYDMCYLRYSNRRFLGIADSGFKVYTWNTESITLGASQFNSSVWATLQGLARSAVVNASARPPMFAVGEMALGTDVEFPKLYGLVQCTRDISTKDCSGCLRNIIGDLPNCCFGKKGRKIIAPSCNFRYEVTPFYNSSAALTLPPIPTTPSPPLPFSPRQSIPVPGTNDTSNSTTMSDDSGDKKSVPIFAIIVPLAVTFFLLILVGCICFKKHKMVKKTMGQEISIESLFFDLSTIRHATNNFSPTNKLGQGGFGEVYKGTLASGEEVAVKRLKQNSTQGVNELKNEVIFLTKLQHKNLVRLRGLCLEDEEKLLLYEYVANKSLDTFLFDSVKKGELNWKRRYNIIIGIAQGLVYLHEYSHVKIIHRDLKAGNILLDAHMNPKISDFGLARLFNVDQSQAHTNKVAGTFGYMPSEYVLNHLFSMKTDVFSFGVLILEIVTGYRRTQFTNEHDIDLLCYVRNHWSSRSAPNILDPSLKGNVQLSEALRCIEVGLSCVQESPNDRPTMSTVVQMLDASPASAREPARPLAGYGTELTFGKVADLPEKPRLRSIVFPANEMSVTELEPR